MKREILDIEVLNNYPEINDEKINVLLNEELDKFNKKIIVLDDDPTGIQTVHGVSVFTSWDKEAIRSGFKEENKMFFILTNSRSFSKDKTRKVHQQIAENIACISNEMNKEFLIVSRGDSTLRGHYPLETEVLSNEFSKNMNEEIHGEILCFYFKEGGRYTIDNIHYVKEGNKLIPAGMTEFARDKTFGYKSSHLGDYVEEKSDGKFKRDNCIYISLDDLRNIKIDKIVDQLVTVKNYSKIIVNAVDYIDLNIFTIALLRAMKLGKKFIIRGAASITKVLGGISNKKLLNKNHIINENNSLGGIILVGSHVNKTSEQLKELMKLTTLKFIEFNQHLVIEENGLRNEVSRVVKLTEENIKNGQTVVIYTKRERLDLDTDDKELQLAMSVEISDSITSIIANLSIRPNFIIAKGGITSSDVGVKALRVRRAKVMGQIKPGIPVWMTGEESKFPQMPYIIFPGNVGENTTLREIVEELL